MKTNLSRIKNSKELFTKPLIKPKNNWEDLFKVAVKLSAKENKNPEWKNIPDKLIKKNGHGNNI
jgi:hypothetical protein